MAAGRLRVVKGKSFFNEERAGVRSSLVCKLAFHRSCSEGLGCWGGEDLNHTRAVFLLVTCVQLTVRNQDVISDEVLRRIQRDIDLAEARLRHHQ